MTNFYAGSHQILSLRRGLRWETQQDPPPISFSKSPSGTHTAPGLLLAGHSRPSSLYCRARRPRTPGESPRSPPPTPSTQATALTHPHWRVPAARGPPGCRQVPQNPRHSLCPQSHSPAGPRRQPPGPPRPLRGPRSPTTRRSQSHQPFSPRLCRSVRLVLGSARRVPRAAPGGRGTVTRAPRGEPLGLGGDGLSAAAPHFLSATGPGSPVTAAAGGRSRDGNAVMSPAEGGGPQDGRRSPLSGHRRAAAGRRRSPRGPGPRYPLAATSALLQDTGLAQLLPGPEAKQMGPRDHRVYRVTAGWQPGFQEHRGGGRSAT